MKRCKIELCSLGFAAAVVALFYHQAPSLESSDSSVLSHQQVIAESALYLDGEVRNLRYDRDTERWRVSDGRDVAWLDAHTGELVELELSPR